MNATIVYGRKGKQYYIGDREVSREEYDACFADRPSLDEVLATEEGRRGLAMALTHDPHHQVGHESLACAVHPDQAAEHAAWIKSQGLRGVKVNPSGTISFTNVGGGAKDKYLAARGMADFSSAGAGSKLLATTPNKKPSRSKRTRRK